jgi:hypothetical protein
MTLNETPDGQPLSIRVHGYCPMGCGESLLVDPDGRVVCCAADCPRSDAVAVLLAEVEAEHLVLVEQDGYTVQHPLRERLEGALFRCSVFAEASEGARQRRAEPGTYRVQHGPGEALYWEYLETGDAGA